MKKKVIIAIIIVLLIILLFPIKRVFRDGGSKEYRALLYSISKIHRYVPESEVNEYVKPYEDGVIIKVLGIELYNTVETNAYVQANQAIIQFEDKEIVLKDKQEMDELYSILKSYKYEDEICEGIFTHTIKINNEVYNVLEDCKEINKNGKQSKIKDEDLKYIIEITEKYIKLEDNNKYSFKAKVLENNGNSNLLVKVLEDSELFKKNETVNVYIKNYKFLNIYYTEDMYLEIFFDGNVEETYPPNISTSSIGVMMPPVSIETKKDTIANNELTIIIKNNSNQTYHYGPQYQIEKFENGKFVIVESKENLVWNSVLYNLKANEEREEIVNLNYGYDKLENGIYRLVRKFTSEENITSSANVAEEFYVEFEIK